MDSDNTIPPVRLRDLENPPTCLDFFDVKPRVSTSMLADAYAFARSRMAGVPSAGAGYRLFWVRGRDVGWMDLPRRGTSAVLGRHTNCDVVLDGAPEISLRHLLAATIELADGLALRLLDLRTSVPFYLDDDAPRSSIVVSGPVAVRFCGYVLGAVPLEADAARPGMPVLPPTLPRTNVTIDNVLPRSVRPGSTSEELWMDLDEPISHVTSMPAPAPITELPRRPAPALPHGGQTPQRGPAPRSGSVCAELTLRGEGRSASVELTEGELDVGVLVGRSDRCHDRGLQAVLDTNISRGHLLLLRQHGGFEAFDLCSTQGTFAGGQRVRRLALPDEGAKITLASKNSVRLTWARVR